MRWEAEISIQINCREKLADSQLRKKSKNFSKKKKILKVGKSKKEKWEHDLTERASNQWTSLIGST